jgi:putative flippase GtrA
VFETGRHARRKEIALFYAVSLTSLALGTGLGAGMIRYGGVSTTLAYAANVVASVLINYAGRKFWVFRG